MAVYINGIGTLSAQPPWNKEEVISVAKAYSGDKVSCVEPDYSQYLDVRQLRRMSRIIKMGMAAGIDALKEANLKVLDGIITGTSYGCLEDTGIFLSKMIENKENALNPTPFIQSTHNTIGSQIALMLQCQGYNQTYTQSGFSFENALVDAIMSIAENENQSILTGAIDEITLTSHNILRRFNMFRSVTNSLALFEIKGKGTIQGEGAAYFVLSGVARPDAVELATVNMLFQPTVDALREGIITCVDSAQVTMEDIDLVIVGKSGDTELDVLTDGLTSELFGKSTIARFKHLTGEFPTSSALAMALACRIVQAQRIPDVIVERDGQRSPKNVLIYNPYFGAYHSLIMLKSC
ncbi:MAG: beta-ketoacyl synthase N-terminal-like domain-containing protein [Chryseolinea sp.]